MGLRRVFLLTNQRIYNQILADSKTLGVPVCNPDLIQKYLLDRFDIRGEVNWTESFGTVWMTEQDYSWYLLRWS
jgi:hypothetical protein